MLIPLARAKHFFWLVAAVLGVLGSSTAAAERGAPRTTPELVALEYQVHPSCPPASRFMAEVAARITRPLVWQDEPFAQRLRVEIVPESHGFWATLTVHESLGTESARSFRTSDCAEAVVALALVAALSIDPSASSAPGSALQRRVPRAPASAPVERTHEGQGWQLELGPILAVTNGPAPVALVSAGVEGALFAERPQLWASHFGLGVHAARTGVASPTADEATFTWTAARAAACPMRLGGERGLSLRPCAMTDLGWVWARGRETGSIRARTAGHFWFALGPALRATYASGPWAVALTGAVLGNFTRNTYIFERPRRPVYDAQAASWTTQAGIAFRW